jgi:AraC family ethanolamine operon transcriptional activator
MRDYETRNFGQNLIGLKNHHLLNAQFRDFEELSAAAAEWDLDFVQLDAGPARTSLTQVSTPALLIQRFRFGRTYFQRGASPLGMQTIGLVEPRASDVRMFGGDLTDSDIALFRPGGDFESVSPPNFGCLAISIDETLLEETFESLEFRRGSCNAASEMALIKVAPSILQRLRYSVTRVLDQLEENPGSLAQSELTDEFTFQLAIDLTLAIRSAETAPRPPSTRARDLALRRAVAIIEDHADEPITVRQLCEDVGVGWTTLVHAFREHFGVTPKVYLRTIRLNGARRELLGGESGASIVDVANRWSFWHMGQFAGDYRRLFGELPSETKARILVPR